MAGWLLKSEPGDYSYSDLGADGRTRWDGVRNPLALKHIREIREGDRAFFYHTGSQRSIVGIARVESDPYPDPDAEDEKIVVFDISADRELARPVSLARIKERKELGDWELVRIPRLSVMPVPEDVWSTILEMSQD